jgi:hypothetical protein
VANGRPAWRRRGVALTRLLQRYPPLAAPPALRPIIDAGARVLARRFVGRYRHAYPTADLTDLDWYTGLHATRVLIDLATWHYTGDSRGNTHPWTLIAPGAATELTRITGIGLNRRPGQETRLTPAGVDPSSHGAVVDAR